MLGENIRKEVNEMVMTSRLFEIGESKGYIVISQRESVSYVRYPFVGKEYRFDNPEEKVRAAVYVELVEDYGYPPDKIRLEEYPPVREGARPSDIVIYSPDDIPFIVVELKRAEASDEEKQSGIRELFGNANLFGVRWALFDCRGERKAYFSLASFSQTKEAVLRKSDIPKAYGQPETFTYGNKIGIAHRAFCEISEFQKVINQCHDIIRDNENLSPLAAFPVISRLIYTKIYDELNTAEGKYYSFQIAEAEESLNVASRIANLYKKASSIEPEVFSPVLGIERPETIYLIVRLLDRYTLYHSPYDIKGEAYQAYLSKIMRGETGQYFTPREVVRPTVEILTPKDDEKMVDPCCGTGGFLVYAYKFLRESILNGYNDAKTRTRKEYDVAHYNIFGIEVDPNVAEACIAAMLLEDDAHGHIAITDALANFDNPTFIKKGIEESKFRVLMTNPPFGKKTRLMEYQQRFTLSKQFKVPPFEVLVLERSLELLAPGGRAGFVIPDINLTTSKVLEFLWDKAIILGVVSLPSETFNPYGSGAKTSVIFFNRKRVAEEKTSRIFMGCVFQIGYDATGRRKGEGRNAYEDVAVQFQKFLEGGDIPFTRNDKYAVFVLEGDKLVGARNNLRVETHLPMERINKEYVPLVQIAQVLRGYTPSWHDYVESGIPVLKVRNLTNRFINFSFERRGLVPRNIYEHHPEARVRLHDILLTASAHKSEYIAKKIDIVDTLPVKECMAVAELLIIRPDLDRINPFYLLSVLRLKEVNEQFRSCIKGTTAHIYPNDIAQNVLVPRLSPEKELQIGENLRKSLEIFREFEATYSVYDRMLTKLLRKKDS